MCIIAMIAWSVRLIVRTFEGIFYVDMDLDRVVGSYVATLVFG